MRRHYPILSIIVAISALFALGIKTSIAHRVDKVDVGSITLAVSQTPLSGPIFVASELGYFDAAGVEVHLLPCQGGHRCFQFLKAGHAGLATSSDSVVMFNSFKERDQFQVLTSFVKSANDVKLLVTDASKIKSISTLNHKTIGVISGSSSEYFLHLLLLVAGIDASDIRTVNASSEVLIEKLKKNEIDAAVLWEPHVYRTVNTAPNISVLDTKGLYDLSFNLLAATSDTPNSEAKYLAVLRGLSKATQFISEKPDQAKTIISRYLNVEDDFVEWIWPDFRFQLTLDNGLISELESQARWAIQNKIVQSTQVPDYRALFNRTLLKDVDASASAL